MEKFIQILSDRILTEYGLAVAVLFLVVVVQFIRERNLKKELKEAYNFIGELRDGHENHYVSLVERAVAGLKDAERAIEIIGGRIK